MTNPETDDASICTPETPATEQAGENGEMESVKAELQARLVVASLRTEAVRAGMVDLDGLKLLDLSSVALDEKDTVINGPEIMRTLRKSKPWLFNTSSSSSAATAPTSKPVRQKSAMEMSDEEYRAARKALIKH